ncbi:MAG: hypothetical protein JO016_16605 [Actinobacteria bacterium]|nr:hypothetical protein [Actinomycetota bacterium]
MNAIFKGLRPLDYVLAALATGGGVYLMHENMTYTGHGQGLVHPLSTTTAAMLPVFLAVTVPILWRRRNILAVIGVTLAALILHVVLFGWVTRCGVVLPLSFALAYAVARFARGRRDHLIGLAGILLFQVVTLTRDSSASLLGALPIAVAGGAIFYGIGRFVQVMVNKKAIKQARDEQPAPATVAA